MNEDNVRDIGPMLRSEDRPVREDHDRHRAETINARHARWLILRTLEAQLGYCMNSRVLQRILDDWALGSTHDALKDMLAWLERAELVTLRRVEDTVVATLRERDADVACGRAFHEGIERPRPSP